MTSPVKADPIGDGEVAEAIETIWRNIGQYVGPSPVVVTAGRLRTLLKAYASMVEERDALLNESAELTKALTGLTCGGSEFFVRRGERYVADIPACVGWVRRQRQDAHERWKEAALQAREVKP